MVRERFATVKDWAERLDCSEDTVRNLEARGVLPRALRSPINNYRVWPREQLEEVCRRLQPRMPEEVPA